MSTTRRLSKKRREVSSSPSRTAYVAECMLRSLSNLRTMENMFWADSSISHPQGSTSRTLDGGKKPSAFSHSPERYAAKKRIGNSAPSSRRSKFANVGLKGLQGEKPTSNSPLRSPGAKTSPSASSIRAARDAEKLAKGNSVTPKQSQPSCVLWASGNSNLVRRGRSTSKSRSPAVAPAQRPGPAPAPAPVASVSSNPSQCGLARRGRTSLRTTSPCNLPTLAATHSHPRRAAVHSAGHRPGSGKSWRSNRKSSRTSVRSPSQGSRAPLNSPRRQPLWAPRRPARRLQSKPCLPIVKTASPPPQPAPLNLPSDSARVRARAWDLRNQHFRLQGLVNRLASAKVDHSETPARGSTKRQRSSNEHLLWARWQRPGLRRARRSCSRGVSSSSEGGSEDEGICSKDSSSPGNPQTLPASTRKRTGTKSFGVLQWRHNPVSESTDENRCAEDQNQEMHPLTRGAEHMAYITMALRASRRRGHPAVSRIVPPPRTPPVAFNAACIPPPAGFANPPLEDKNPEPKPEPARTPPSKPTGTTGPKGAPKAAAPAATAAGPAGAASAAAHVSVPAPAPAPAPMAAAAAESRRQAVRRSLGRIVLAPKTSSRRPYAARSARSTRNARSPTGPYRTRSPRDSRSRGVIGRTVAASRVILSGAVPAVRKRHTPSRERQVPAVATATVAVAAPVPAPPADSETSSVNADSWRSSASAPTRRSARPVNRIKSASPAEKRPALNRGNDTKKMKSPVSPASVSATKNPWIYNSSVKAYKDTLGAIMPAATALLELPSHLSHRESSPGKKQTPRGISPNPGRHTVLPQSGARCVLSGQGRPGVFVSLENNVATALPTILSTPRSPRASKAPPSLPSQNSPLSTTSKDGMCGQLLKAFKSCITGSSTVKPSETENTTSTSSSTVPLAPPCTPSDSCGVVRIKDKNATPTSKAFRSSTKSSPGTSHRNAATRHKYSSSSGAASSSSSSVSSSNISTAKMKSGEPIRPPLSPSYSPKRSTRVFVNSNWFSNRNTPHASTDASKGIVPSRVSTGTQPIPSPTRSIATSPVRSWLQSAFSGGTACPISSNLMSGSIKNRSPIPLPPFANAPGTPVSIPLPPPRRTVAGAPRPSTARDRFVAVPGLKPPCGTIVLPSAAAITGAPAPPPPTPHSVVRAEMNRILTIQAPKTEDSFKCASSEDDISYHPEQLPSDSHTEDCGTDPSVRVTAATTTVKASDVPSVIEISPPRRKELEQSRASLHIGVTREAPRTHDARSQPKSKSEHRYR